MTLRRTRGVLAIEGVQTSDGRLFDSFTWIDPPMPFGWLKDQQLHGGMGGAGAVDVGNITTLERVGNEIVFTGAIDDEIPEGAEMIRRMEAGSASHGARFGVSVDMDNLAVEIVQNPDSVAAPDPESEDGEDGIVILASAQVASLAMGTFLREFVARQRAATFTAAAGDAMPDDGEVLFAMAMDEVIEHYTRARIIGAVALPAGAFNEGVYIELDDTAPGDDIEAPAEERAPVVAAAAPLRPPRAWFFEPEPEDGDPRLVPQYDDQTGAYIGDALPLVITDDGQFYGHLNPRERCHIGYANVCITAPSDTSFFHIGAVQVDDGSLLEGTGVFVVGGNHAGGLLNVNDARDYYANTSCAWGDGIVHPGHMGGWCCGALRPGVTDELVRTLRAGGISGDWRGSDKQSLISVLGVNAPGLPIQRRRAYIDSTEPIEVAAGEAVMTASASGFTIITAPVARAAAKEPCGCGGHGPTDEAQVMASVLARLDGIESGMAQFRTFVDQRTAPLRAEAAQLAAETLRNLRRHG
jgi:hypothetical protein